MKRRTLDEQLSYFNQRVSEMDIPQKYKMELLGMVTAIGFNVTDRPTGKWIHYDDKSYAGDGYEECSCCGWKYSDWIFIEDSKFCPNCGATMEVNDGTKI